RLAARMHVDDGQSFRHHFASDPNIFCRVAKGIASRAKPKLPSPRISFAARSTAPKAAVVSLEPSEMRRAPASDNAPTVKPSTARIFTGRETEEQTVRTISMSVRPGA